MPSTTRKRLDLETKQEPEIVAFSFDDNEARFVVAV